MVDGRSTVAKAVVLVLLALPGGCGVFAFAVYKGIEGTDVGPDADEMAKDPVLHIRLEGATADRILTSQGHEGGIAPALANSTSEASRAWHSDTDDWLGLLLSAVTKVDAEKVQWTSLSCYDDLIALVGWKQVAVGSDMVGSTVEIYLSEIGSTVEPLRLSIILSSDEERASDTFRPNLTQELDANCPAELIELTASAR